MAAHLDWIRAGNATAPRVERAAWLDALAALRAGSPVQVIGPLGLGRDILIEALVRSTGAAHVRYCDTAHGRAAWLGRFPHGVVVDGPSTVATVDGRHRVAADAMFTPDASQIAALESIPFRLAALPSWHGETRDMWRRVELER